MHRHEVAQRLSSDLFGSSWRRLPGGDPAAALCRQRRPCRRACGFGAGGGGRGRAEIAQAGGTLSIRPGNRAAARAGASRQVRSLARGRAPSVGWCGPGRRGSLAEPFTSACARTPSMSSSDWLARAYTTTGLRLPTCPPRRAAGRCSRQMVGPRAARRRTLTALHGSRVCARVHPYDIMLLHATPAMFPPCVRASAANTALDCLDELPRCEMKAVTRARPRPDRVWPSPATPKRRICRGHRPHDVPDSRTCPEGIRLSSPGAL